jgi:hypothetical protein
MERERDHMQNECTCMHVNMYQEDECIDAYA